MTETLTTSGSVKAKAGTNFSTAATAENYTDWINQAESAIVIESGVDYVATFSGLTASKKEILNDAASSHAAIALIGYDPNVWSLATAQTKLDINWTRFKEAMRLLKDKKNSDFLSKT